MFFCLFLLSNEVLRRESVVLCCVELRRGEWKHWKKCVCVMR
jgi:hypothetical protein